MQNVVYLRAMIYVVLYNNVLHVLKECYLANLDNRMNIVFAVYNPAVFSSLEKVFRYLCGVGHQVKVLYGDYDRPHIGDRALKTCQKELSNFEAVPMLSRKEVVTAVQCAGDG